ncbi:MAG TPA: hypothetical protein DCQ30_07905 [Acidimicrobiaceae bacterium]|nr:hypothetical protein [Acidimicrobiaceae bacterium]
MAPEEGTEVNERVWGRVGALSGLVFVVLSLLGAFLYPEQPRSDSPAAVTAAWVHNHRVALQAGMIISLFAAGALVWFVGYLRTRIGDERDRAVKVGATVLSGGIAVAIMSALAVMPTAILAFMDAQPGGIHDAVLVRMLGDLNTVFFSAVSVMSVVFLAALGAAMLDRQLPAPWLGWLSLVFGVVNGVAVWVEITFSSYHGKVWNTIGWGAYIGFLAVILLSSLTTMGGRLETRARSLAVS